MSVETLIGLDERMRRLCPRDCVLVTAGAVALMTLLRWLFHDWLQLLPFLPYFPVVVACAALFGARYGYLAAGLAFPLAVYLFVPPAFTFHVSAQAWLSSILFLLVLLFCAWTVGLLKDVALRLYRAERESTSLFGEMNHRIKNNLQMVSSLLMLESVRFPDPEIKRVLSEAIARIGVIGQLHTLLYFDGTSDTVRADEFLKRVCDDLRVTFIGSRRIALEMRAQPLTVSADRAIPIGLVVNEAVTNALRHGFPPGCHGTVWVDLSVEGDHAVLAVSDDGAGIDGSLPKGLGGRIIEMMAHQMAGAAAMSERVGGGTVVRLTFPLV